MDLLRQFIKVVFKHKHIRELEVFKDDGDKNNYVNLIKIDDMKTFSKYYSKILSDFSQYHGKYAYRGVNNASYRIYSSLQRSWRWNGLENLFKDHISYIKFQINKIGSLSIVRDYLHRNNVHDYNVLALIQHYGGDSNLVDFTIDPNIALFFAFDKVVPSNKEDSLSNYVSLYSIDVEHPILGGPKEVSEVGSVNMQVYLKNSTCKPTEDSVNGVLRNLSMPAYDKAYDGKIVHYGTNIYVPMFNYKSSNPISNANLQAQSGIFFQSSSDDVPLEELFKEQHQFLIDRILTCYDINKKLIPEIKRRYNINYQLCDIYPYIPQKRSLERAVRFSMVKLFVKFIFNGFRKISIH